MKIKVKDISYSEIKDKPARLHIKPVRQSAFLRGLAVRLSKSELNAVGFSYETHGMDRLASDEPALFLMNHSSFTDLQIAATLLADRQYHIICTNDGLVGKAGLMARMGCIPAKKFISDINLIRDMKYAINELNSSILMYPEASYSFDGCETALPDSVGKLLKILRVPVVMIRTKGAFLRDPLYNCLQKRNVKVSADVTYLLSKEDTVKLSVGELNNILADAFRIDNFREQYEAGVVVNEPFRADGLHRVLYKCPECLTEGEMIGEGVSITCKHCGLSYMLGEDGRLVHQKSERSDAPKFEFVSDWYKWERRCVSEEINAGAYRLDIEVDIIVMMDFDSVYHIGKGRLIHDSDGFTLTGADGELEYHQTPASSYSLYADYYWYEIGDMISIGDANRQYYCFPIDQGGAIVAKARLAAEELYKIRT